MMKYAPKKSSTTSSWNPSGANEFYSIADELNNTTLRKWESDDNYFIYP